MSGKKNPRTEVRFNFSVINKIRSIICVETFRMIAQKSMCWETAPFGGCLFKHTVVLKIYIIQLMMIILKE